MAAAQADKDFAHKGIDPMKGSVPFIGSVRDCDSFHSYVPPGPIP